jgi:hypothetical protein
MKRLLFVLLFLGIVNNGTCLPGKNPSFSAASAQSFGNGDRSGWLSIASDTFEFHKKAAAIPAFLMAFLKKPERNFRLADSGSSWNAGCTILDPKLPRHQLTFFGRGKRHLVLVYESGGIGRHTQVLLVRHEGNQIREHLHFSSLPKISTFAELVAALR